MARVAGVDLPKNKRVEIGLTYIYGVGRSRSRQILANVSIDMDKKVGELSEDEVNTLRKALEEYDVEGDLRKNVSLDIKRLKDLGCYRGLRHRSGLPVRGQNTKNNSRTRKGPKRTVGKKK
ncbi:30S ribosomal protein S13 [Desulfurispirillum indicum]|uniref:Small ribosomal subunit protein uS13 n=1 Tax=Desulfurispirillum indicum (strain ATCC BAA-1389 / DSM 22839 / S5) TaxID=653733 RepID=E6W734_DESIS|nr:30S ribosomal protein S13 [Desulfurispirillum indicum]ADU65112.1 30S ribosomal protein S13 [Desulfurispirillum indicum S5]UCZ57015.1 30S ribosomal protein S13 [Desulfurispirillum indicum]